METNTLLIIIFALPELFIRNSMKTVNSLTDFLLEVEAHLFYGVYWFMLEALIWTCVNPLKLGSVRLEKIWEVMWKKCENNLWQPFNPDAGFEEE